MLVVLYI